MIQSELAGRDPVRHNLGCNMAKTITKAEDVDLSWLSWNPGTGSFIGNWCGQIVSICKEGDEWLAWINGEGVENEAGEEQDRWPSKEEAAQVVMAMCEIMADHEQGD